MILNPTHEITLSGLPSDVLNAYVRYKKGSRAIVSWLVQFGPSNHKGVRTLPIKELAALARSVSTQIKQLPDVIHFHFKETIAARKCLSKYFRVFRDEDENDLDTVNHEHFTNSLHEIYEELCQQCRSAQEARDARRLQRGGRGSVARKLRNHYDCLPVEDTTSLEDALANLTTNCTQCEDDARLSCPTPNDIIGIEGDELAMVIENVVLLDRAQKVLDAVENCWEGAGRGDLSFIAVAAVTNTAWMALCEVASELEAISPDISVDVMHQRCCTLGNSSKKTGWKYDTEQQHKFLEALEGSGRAVKHYVDGHQLTAIQSCASCVQKPADYIQSPEHPSPAVTTDFQIALLDNVLHLVNYAGGCPALALTSSPCLTQVGHLLSQSGDPRSSFRCSLAIHVLAMAYRAFLVSSTNPSAVPMCRIAALRLAQQAAVSVKAVLSDKHAFPCQCPQTLAFHLSNLEHDLNGYAKHKCWDLYFQSPWVAGTHIIEMLDILSYYGMRLFYYRHFVGSVLHTYNVVQQLCGLEKIPLLEELCQDFEELFFPAGGKPSMSFKNSWSRFVGARLKFQKGHKSHNHRESWCMAVPAHAARTAAGFGTSSKQGDTDPKFNYGRFDPLMMLKQEGYQSVDIDSNNSLTSISPKASISTQRKIKSRTSSSSRPSTSSSVNENGSTFSTSSSSASSTTNNNSTSFSCQQEHQLTKLAYLLDSSFDKTHHDHQGSLPSTRLNLLAIFTTCTKIVGKISDRIHTSSTEKDCKNCICFTTTLLSGADRITDGRKVGRLECWKKDERELIEIVKEVMIEVMRDVGKGNAAEWLWDV